MPPIGVSISRGYQPQADLARSQPGVAGQADAKTRQHIRRACAETCRRKSRHGLEGWTGRCPNARYGAWLGQVRDYLFERYERQAGPGAEAEPISGSARLDGYTRRRLRAWP